MEDKRKALKDIAHFSVSTWVNFFLGFISTFILTRVFIPEVLGTINLFYSSITAFLYVVCLGLDNGYLRFFNEPPQGENRVSFLFKVLLISLLVAVLVGLITYCFFAENVVDFFLGQRSRNLLICIILGVLDQTVFRFLILSSRMKMDIRRYNIQTIAINLITRLSVLLGALIDKSSVFWAIYMNVGCMTLLAFFFLIWQRKEWFPKTINLNLSGYRQVIIFSLLGMLASVAIHINTLCSQIVLKTFIGTYAVGIFTSAAIFASVLSAVKGGFLTYWSAYMYSNYKDETKREWMMEVHDIVMLVSIFIIAFFFSFRSIIYLFIGPEFRSSKEFFSLILLFPLLQFVQETTQYGIPISKNNYITTIIFILTLLINVGVGMWLVPQIGIAGQAWGNAISGIFCYILITFFGQRFYKTIKNKYRSLAGLGLIIFLSVATYFLKTDVPVIILSVLSVVIACLLYHNTLNKSLSLIMSYLGRK